MKAINLFRNACIYSAVIMAGSVSSAFAADTDSIDFSTLTAHISWSSVITAVLAVAAGVAILNLGIRGAKLILSFIKSN